MADMKGAAPALARVDPTGAVRGKDTAAAPKPAAKPAEKKKNPKRLIIAMVALLLVAAAGGGAYFLLADSGEASSAPAAGSGAQKAGDKEKARDKEKDKKIEARKPFFIEFETFTVNLRDPEKFLQIKLTFQVETVAEAELIKEMMPIVRSAVIPVLSSQSPEELMTSEGKERLTGELVEAANKSIAGHGIDNAVRAVLITHMIIQ